MRRKNVTFPRSFDLSRLASVHSVRAFDAAYTAPHFGFQSAEDYYYRASALRVVSRIQVPTLIITAKNDPFVPVEPFADPALTSNSNITLIVADHGGHCGFLSPPGANDDGYWAEHTIVDFAGANAQ